MNCIGFYINISSQETARGILHRCGNAASFFIPKREKRSEAGEKKKGSSMKVINISHPISSRGRPSLTLRLYPTRFCSLRWLWYFVSQFLCTFCYLLVVYVISQCRSCYLSFQFVRKKKNWSWTRQTFIFLVRDRINSSQILCNKYFIVSKQGCR